jgi:hypothetical protein
VYAVAEATARFAVQVRNLGLSVGQWGGRLQLGLVGGGPTTGEWKAGLSHEIPVDVTDVERVSTRFPHANKLAGLARIEADRPGWAVLSDCDMVFEQPPITPTDETAAVILADAANRNRVPLAVWRWVAKRLQEPGLSRNAAAGTLPYLNSGLLYLHPLVQSDLLREWQRAVTQLSDITASMPTRRWQFFTDQIGLTIAIGRLGVEVAPLPPGENLPTHIPSEPAGPTPRSLHYHDAHTPDGFLLPPYSDRLRVSVDTANARLAQHLGQPVPSLRMLSLRYRSRRRGRAAKHALQRQ